MNKNLDDGLSILIIIPCVASGGLGVITLFLLARLALAVW